jgi:hypothetical protein
MAIEYYGHKSLCFWFNPLFFTLEKHQNRPNPPPILRYALVYSWPCLTFTTFKAVYQAAKTCCGCSCTGRHFFRLEEVSEFTPLEGCRRFQWKINLCPNTPLLEGWIQTLFNHEFPRTAIRWVYHWFTIWTPDGHRILWQ